MSEMAGIFTHSMSSRTNLSRFASMKSMTSLIRGPWGRGESACYPRHDALADDSARHPLGRHDRRGVRPFWARLDPSLRRRSDLGGPYGGLENTVAPRGGHRADAG